jgi:hypothetical protein
MIDRRTYARIAFVGQLLRLVHEVSKQRTAQKEGIQLRRELFVAGVIYAIGSSLAHDRDVGGIRSNWKHRGLLGGLLVIVGVVLGSQTSKSTFHDFALGDSLGRLCYRFWYGVLRPLPTDGQ